MSDARDKVGWMDKGLCTDPDVDPDTWFDPARRDEAIAMCDRCPVADRCSERATEHNAYRGVWAGMPRMPKNPGRSTTSEYLAPAERHRHSKHKRAARRADGRAWPGFTVRFCPVCGLKVGTHRKPVTDERGEVVEYHQHDDTTRKPCRMAGKDAAIRAVAFTGRGR